MMIEDTTIDQCAGRMQKIWRVGDTLGEPHNQCQMAGTTAETGMFIAF